MVSIESGCWAGSHLVLFSALEVTGSYTTRDTRADPAEPKRILDDRDSPAAPTDCRVATKLPEATPPPLAMADTDIILAAKEEAVIPAPVKPTAPRTTGTAPTVTAPATTAVAALAPNGKAVRVAAGDPSRQGTFSVPSRDPTVDAAVDAADAAEPRAALDVRVSPIDDSPARTLPEAAPPALARVATDVTLAMREEARMPSMVCRIISTQKSQTCMKGGALVGMGIPSGISHCL